MGNADALNLTKGELNSVAGPGGGRELLFRPGDNQITILCDRYHLNELGTGGLMGPVVLYREK